MEFSIGQVIKGVWEIEDIKQGGMGTVYFARVRSGSLTPGGDQQQGLTGLRRSPKGDEESRAAIKSMSSDFYYTGANSDQFKQEGLIWISLPPHPYIISCTTVEGVEEAPLIILEYASGGSLRDKLANGPLPLQEALRLSRQVCAGMEFLAECGNIVHRDLKPENLLLSSAGDVKITDFGLASVQRYGMRVLLGDSPGEEISSRPMERFVGGTVPYMSPEHFGVAEVTVQSDIYSFGAVLFEVLEGRLLFEGTTFNAFRQAHLYEKPPQLSKSVGPRKLGKIIKKCTEKVTSRRFLSFAELDEALAEVIADERMVIPKPLSLTIEEAESRITADGWTRRGYALARLRRFEESLRGYQRAYELDPEALGANGNLGLAMGRVGRFEERLAYNKKEVELHPEEPYSHYNLAAEYVRRDKMVEAEEQLSIAVNQSPENIVFMRDLATLYHRLGRGADSDRLVERVAREMLNRPNTYVGEWVNEGVQFGLRELFPQSLQMFDYCVQRYPNDPNCWYNRAVTLLAMKDLDGAINSVHRALSERGDLPQGRFLLGMLHLLQEDGRKATIEWQHLIRSDPGHKFGKMASFLLPLIYAWEPRQVVEFAFRELRIPSDFYYR